MLCLWTHGTYWFTVRADASTRAAAANPKCYYSLT